MSVRKHLQTLGLQQSAGKKEIKSVYRDLVKKYHPDINNAPDAAEQFMKIHRAYEALLDEGSITPPIYHNPASKEDVHQEWKEERANRMEREEQPWHSSYKLKKNAAMYRYLSGIIFFILPIGVFFIHGKLTGNEDQVKLSIFLAMTFVVIFWILIRNFIRAWRNRH